MTYSFAKHTAIAAAATLSLVAMATPASAAEINTPAQVTSQSIGHAQAGVSVLGDMTFEKKKKRKYRKNSKRYRNYSRDARYNQRVSHNTRVWRGRDGRAYCRRDDGTTGLLIGAGVGALIGNEVAGRGDRTLGAILGAAGGALLGREIDRSNVRCR